jgi:hypothetical protein
VSQNQLRGVPLQVVAFGELQGDTTAPHGFGEFAR